jgi:hypothetical protein
MIVTGAVAAGLGDRVLGAASAAARPAASGDASLLDEVTAAY